jgi:uncharacterized protein YndB with AHSA1/START domain
MSLTVTTPTDRTIAMSRSFAAPRELVFAAHSQPEHVKHWWGRGNPLDVEMDFTVGGKWRFVEHADGEPHAFRGEYREIDPPFTFTWTFEYEPMPGHVAVERYEFDESDGRTTVTVTATFDSEAMRDQMLKSGMETGAEESYQALDAYLASMS